MKILFLGGNMARNEVKKLADWLEQQGETVIYKEDKLTIDDIKQINPAIVISYNYQYLIPKEIIKYLKGNIINLHTSLLPWNRGVRPNVWSFLEDTPKGVTIHYIDEGIDTGDIIVQKEVFFDEDKETLKSSYEKLHKEIQELFKENWEKIKTGKIEAKRQPKGGTLGKTLSRLNNSSKKRDEILLLESLRKNLEIGNVVLKNFINLTQKEREIVLRWRNNENIRKWMYQDHIISKEEHTEFLKRLKESSRDLYWLIKNKGGEYIGVIYLNRIDFRNKNAYLGIYANPSIKGVGQILMDCLKKIAFDILHLHTMKLEVIETNERAIKFYKKSGFKEEGRLKEFVFKDGMWQDAIVMGILLE